METIRFLLSKIIKIVIALGIMIGILWFINLAFPGLNIMHYLRGDAFSSDWLPAPRNLGTLNNVQQSQYGSEYVHTNPIPYSYITYASTTSGTPSHSRSYYLRNLSVYDGAMISEGRTIYGEARDVMFKNGAFPIIIVDARGQYIASMQAVNTGTWATPGWGRFQATVPVRLPNAACSLVFLSAQQNIQLRVFARCN